MEVFVEGTSVEVLPGTLVGELPGLATSEVIAALVDEVPVDLATPVVDGASIVAVLRDSEVGLSIIRHSSAHLLAQAVLRLFPGTKYAIGPSTADGFYYDFELKDGAHFEESDLAVLEEEMRRIVDEDQGFVRSEYAISDALTLFRDQPYKVEIIERVRAAVASEEDLMEGASATAVSVYSNGEGFVDLCRGPHVPRTGLLGAYALVRVSGVYWRGDERNAQLQRIYGLAFDTREHLARYQEQLLEAERRDHRRLGAELDLFHFPPEIGGGLPVFHPRGAHIRYRMEEFSREEHLRAGYELVWTPHIAKSTLYETSGHLEWYKDGMYPPMEMDGGTYYPKPMNCPMHILVYTAQPRSYRDLPLRFFEFGTVYRYERSGTLHGLARVRGLTQDDAHIFCTPEQLTGELTRLLSFVFKMLGAFGLTDYEAELATKPEKSVGSMRDWEFATDAARTALERSGVRYRVAPGEGAFYAPKIDVHLTDAIGRRWQVSTVQIDLQLPQRFDLEFQDRDNEKKQPYMIHRALFGSVERFLAILIEHYSGNLPAWLVQEQVRILPVVAEAQEYALELKSDLKSLGVGSAIVVADEPLGARVRRAKLARVPAIAVVGKRDIASRTVGFTPRGTDASTEILEREDFLERMRLSIQVPAFEVEV
ncbi:MAG: threonine--tRNA ligase [Ferrimicrobium sp.]